MEREYLPQYAAEAILDLEKTLKLMDQNSRTSNLYQLRMGADIHDRTKDEYAYFKSAMISCIAFLRKGIHIVLPLNGEVYRESAGSAEILPTKDEVESLVGLPAPITCFEYAWTHKSGFNPNSVDGVGDSQSPKRITIAIDAKQFGAENSLPEGSQPAITLLSVAYDEHFKMWSLVPFDMTITSPPEILPDPYSTGRKNAWGMRAEMRNLLTSRHATANDEETSKHFGQFKSDLHVMFQACNALRIGATLTEHTDKSHTRTRVFEKKGVGGIVYHVLKLPRGSSKETLEGYRETGDRDGPRYHFRRAHIRTLPTGATTFVRHCFVGDRSKGEVDKYYSMKQDVGEK